MAFKTDVEAVVLGVLGEGAKHGYEISKRIRELSGEVLSLGDGLIYPALHKMEKEGLVSAIWTPQEGKPARKTYTLTTHGSEALKRHREEWQRFQGGVLRILGATNA